MDSLTKSMNDILQNYITSVDVESNAIIKYCAQDAVKKLRVESPSASGEYAKNWSLKTKRVLYNNVYIIYNKAPTYRLTHLLENGHDVVVNGIKVGRAPAHVHIAPVEGWLENEIISRLAEQL